MKKHVFRKLFSLAIAALPLVGMAQRVSLPYGYAARGGMSYCPNTYLPGWMAVDPDYPVQDATFLIKNPKFSSGADGWNCTKTLTVTDGQASMSGVFDVYQELEGIPNGVYELSVNGFYEGEKSPRCAWLYAGHETMALRTAEEGDPDNLWDNANRRTVRTIVINHNLRIGVKGIYDNEYPVSFDNFQLSYVGKYVAGFEATIAENYTGEEADAVPVGSWNAGQEVAVHADNASYQYKALGNGEQTILVAGDNGYSFPKQNLSYTAVRPYNEADAANNTLTLSPTQTYFENGIDTLANPMAAIINQGEDLSFSFKNVCGLLQLNLTGDNVSVQTITVRANNGAKLCGTGTLSFNNGNPEWNCTDGDDNVSLVVPDEGTVSLETPKSFYIALPPATYDGLTVTVTDGTTDGTCELQFDNVGIVRSGVTATDATVVYKSLKVPASLALGMDKESYKTKTLTATVVPANSEVEWSCSPTGVVELSSTSDYSTIIVTAQTAGTATITATASNGLTATCTVHVAPVGAIPEPFTVSSGKQVYFSKGNLWYDKSPETGGQHWGFEAHQYDFRTYPGKGSMLGGAYNTGSGTLADTYGLFGFGDAPTNGGNIKTSTTDSDYTWPNDGTDPWGSKIAEGWRTLTKDEMAYLLNTGGGSNGRDASWTRFAKATVMGVPGLMVFPDGTTGTTVGGVTINSANATGAGFTANTVSDASDWSSMETAGCVFLPCAGYRNGTSVSNVGSYGNYWSSTVLNASYAYGLTFSSGGVNPSYNNGRHYNGFSVRLAYLPVPAESVSLDNTTMVIGKGDGDVKEVKQLRATLVPSNSTDAVTWTSSDETAATVDETGKVTAVSAGTTVITATTTSGKTATCTVNVVTLKEFSVSATEKVHFSTGNLTYSVTDSKWTFYGNQYDHASGYDTSLISLFCWGYNETNSIKPDDYTTNSSFNDWGDADAVKGDIGSGWRTLTQAEWAYLLNTRTMTNSGKPRYTNKSGGVAIGGSTYKGLFVYPDDYNGEEVGSGGPSTWDAINDAGIVFLPCAGFRNGTSVNNVGTGGYYWSSSPHSFVASLAYLLYFGSGNIVEPTMGGDRYVGWSVRLVC